MQTQTNENKHSTAASHNVIKAPSAPLRNKKFAIIKKNSIFANSIR